MEGSVSVLWWEEVHLCRCRFFFFLRKDEVRKARMEKQRVKEGAHRTAHKQNNPKHTQEALLTARHGSVACRYENKKNEETAQQSAPSQSKKTEEWRE